MRKLSIEPNNKFIAQIKKRYGKFNNIGACYVCRVVAVW